ncbi:DUF1643 domain-containing protein [Chachezhania antarctica]|uniref:DUF1643 domain-containing protein n=1 Tax=Chachezhania antarctica TaxID=2340860 RepID=UPI000EAB5497|nr:DUF1643 domain-containing protein [Chachezhania antarctica]
MTGPVERTHDADGTRSTAVYSACERYRYALTREWDASAGRITFVMLNPSTASELRNDPTIERCERRARAWGYGAFRVTNLFAWRATDPRDLKRAAEPDGPENEVRVLESAAWADLVLAAWGVHGAHRNRGPEIAALLGEAGTPVAHLGLTKAGHPRHPLYVSYATRPIPWT